MTDKIGQTGLESKKTPISLYEFYVIGIERLLVKAPWELERAVSAYHERFLTEQRCIGLAILLLLGEEYVPKEALKTLPGFESQTRASISQATFTRALRNYFESNKLNPVRADLVFERMRSYLTDSQAANEARKSPLEAMLTIMAKRVPPKDDVQREQYAARVEKIYDYIDGLVNNTLLKRYSIQP